MNTNQSIQSIPFTDVAVGETFQLMTGGPALYRKGEVVVKSPTAAVHHVTVLPSGDIQTMKMWGNVHVRVIR